MLLAGCGGSSTDSRADEAGSTNQTYPDDSYYEESFSQAFCDDLRRGYSPADILFHDPLVAIVPKPAERAYKYAARSCPGELQYNGQLRQFLENWNIDPDS